MIFYLLKGKNGKWRGEIQECVGGLKDQQTQEKNIVEI